MKPSAISEALRVLVAARQPVFIWSSPGAGKSAIVHQLAEALKATGLPAPRISTPRLTAYWRSVLGKQ